MDRCIIFDIDGTLTDTYDVDGDCFFETISEMTGILSIDKNWENYPHVTDSGIVTRLFELNNLPGPSSEEMNSLEMEFCSRLKKIARNEESFKQMIGASEFVDSLEKKEVPIGLATGSWRSSASFKLEKIGLGRFTSKMVSGSEAISREEILLKSIGNLGCSPSQAWYFGDGSWDVKCTSKLGINFFGIGPKLKDQGLKHWADDFSDTSQISSIIFS